MRLLSFDGGGIKGVIPARIVCRLDAMRPEWRQDVSAVFGVSTGAIIAAALSVGIPSSDIVDLYKLRGPEIFSSRGVMDSASGFVDEVFRANYGREGIDTVLRDVFGDAVLGDCVVPLIVPTFNLTTGSPRYFKGWPGSPDRDILLADILGATSAAPTYFPAKCIGGDFYVDGGLFNNNPSDSAVAEAIDRGVSVDSVSVFSFGCGRVGRSFVDPDDHKVDWGYKGWMVPPKLLDVIFDSSLIASTFRAKRALGDRFCRVNPVLGRSVGLDDTSVVSDIIDLADRFDLSGVVSWLDAHWAI